MRGVEVMAFTPFSDFPIVNGFKKIINHINASEYTSIKAVFQTFEVLLI